MAHYWHEIKTTHNSLFEYARKEILQLRTYAKHRLSIRNNEDALKAISSAIALNNQLLNRCAIDDNLRVQMMQEGINNMKVYLEVSKNENAKKKQEPVAKEETSCPQLWNINPNLPSADAAEGFKRFSTLLTLPSGESSQWEKVIGHEEAKRDIERAITYPLKYKEVYEAEDLERGILLFGPPGTGKTMLAKSIASKVEVPYLELKCTQMMSKWLGQTEENIRYFFALAQHVSPCVVFLDEVDSIAGQRDGDGDTPESKRGICNQLLTSMDSAIGIYVVAATNFPWQLDLAFARRLTKKRYIPLPTKEERLLCIKRELKKFPNTLLEIDVTALNDEFEYFSNDDIIKWFKTLQHKKGDKLSKCKYHARTSQGKWYPCSKYHPGAVGITHTELRQRGEKPDLPYFTLLDFQTDRPMPSANEDIIQKYNEYNESLFNPKKKFSAKKSTPTYTIPPPYYGPPNYQPHYQPHGYRRT